MYNFLIFVCIHIYVCTHFFNAGQEDLRCRRKHLTEYMKLALTSHSESESSVFNSQGYSR